MSRARLTAIIVIGLACARGAIQPAPVDTRSDACASCRMAVSDVRFAAQIVAPGEEPKFFDDVGCLRDYLKRGAVLPRGSVAFVADHRTRQWSRAAGAVFTRRDSLETPMASHIIAHGSVASRDSDPDSAGGTPVSALELFGPAGPPEGKP